MFGGHSLQHTQDKGFTHPFLSLLTLPGCLKADATQQEEAAFSPTLLHLHKKLLKFCFQLTEGMPEPHKVLSQFQSARHNCLYSPPSPAAAAMQWHSLITPAPPNWHWITPSIAGLFFPCHSAPGTLPVIPLLKSRAEIFFASLSLWGAVSEKEFCDILWRAQHKNKLYRVK